MGSCVIDWWIADGMLLHTVTVTISSDEDEGPSAEASRQPSTSSLVATPTAQEDDDAFFPFPVSKPTSFGTLRRHRMEDAVSVFYC